MKTPDEILVQRMLDGDKSSFGILVERYRHSVFRHSIKTTRDFHEAEDITQDVFVEAYLNLPRLKEPAKFGSWLRGITQNLCRMWMRKKRVLSDLEIPLDNLQTEVLNQWLREQENSESWEFGTDVVNKLSDEQKDLLKLFYIDSHSCREIAQQMGASEVAIRKRLSRTRQQLKTELLEGEKNMNGMIAISAVCTSILGNVLYASAEKRRYDFSDGNLKGWTVWNLRGGNSVWKVESGKVIAEREDIWATHLILDEDIGWKDYEMEFGVMIEQLLNPKAAFVVIGVRVDKSNNMSHIGPALAYNWGAENRKVIYVRALKGTQEFDLEFFDEHPYPIQTQQWYRLKLSAIGNQFRYYVA